MKLKFNFPFLLLRPMSCSLGYIIGRAKQTLSSNSGITKNIFVCVQVIVRGYNRGSDQMYACVDFNEIFHKGSRRQNLGRFRNWSKSLKSFENGSHLKYLHDEILFLKTNNNKQKLVKS